MNTLNLRFLALYTLLFFPMLAHGKISLRLCLIDSKPGISVDSIQKMAKKLDLDLSLETRSMPYCEKLLEDGNTDAVPNITFETKRMQIGAYPMLGGMVNPDYRLTTLNYYVYRKKGTNISWDGHKFSNINGTLGSMLGFSIINDLHALGQKTFEARSVIELLRTLDNGRIDAIVIYPIMLKPYINQFPDLEVIEAPFSSKDLYLMFSYDFIAKNSELPQQIWENFKVLREQEETGSIPLGLRSNLINNR